MFWVIAQSKHKITFGTLDEMFVYISNNEIIEGFAGYKL